MRFVVIYAQRMVAFRNSLPPSAVEARLEEK